MRLPSMSPTVRVWLVLALTHGALAVAGGWAPAPSAWALFTTVTVYLPLWPAMVLDWPVTTRDQWPIAPPNALGWGLVVLGWALVHALLARGLVALRRRAMPPRGWTRR